MDERSHINSPGISIFVTVPGNGTQFIFRFSCELCNIHTIISVLRLVTNKICICCSGHQSLLGRIVHSLCLRLTEVPNLCVWGSGLGDLGDIRSCSKSKLLPPSAPDLVVSVGLGSDIHGMILMEEQVTTGGGGNDIGFTQL